MLGCQRLRGSGFAFALISDQIKESMCVGGRQCTCLMELETFQTINLQITIQWI